MWGSQPQGIDDIVKRISENDPSLRSLYLMRHRRFNEEDAAKLADALSISETLTELNLSSHAISPRIAGIVGSGLKSNQSIEFISIGNSAFGDEAMVELCACFEGNTSIKTLDLERKGLTCKSASAVCRAVEKSTSLKHMMLSHNDLRGGLEDILPCVSGLESFISHSCGIGCVPSSRALSTAMGKATALKRVELDSNMLDADSAVVLAEGLSDCSSLEMISLGSNSLGPEGIQAIVNALPIGIQSIDISHTDAQDAGVCSLAACIGSHKLPRVKYINISGCNVTGRGISTLLRAATTLTPGTKLDVDAGENPALGDDSFLLDVLNCPNLRSLRLHGCNLGSRGVESLIGCLEAYEGDVRSLRDLDVSGNNIPEDCMLTLLSQLASTHGKTLLSDLETLVIAANPDVEGHKIADAVDTLYRARPNLVVIRAASDSSGQRST